jgi:Xaa-Pro dipeptidase
MIREKIKNIQKLLRDQAQDVLVLANIGHQTRDDLLYYLLLTHLELGVMLIPARGKPTLYAISFEVVELQQTYPDIRVVPLRTAITDILPKKGNICFRPSAFPASQLLHIPARRRVSLIGEEVCMGIKLREEQKIMKKAGQITDAIFSSLVTHWSEFVTETDVATFIRKQCLEHNVEPSFPPIVASGTHASNPHHHPLAKKLKKGFCVIDMGVRYKGYCSDMTRTVYIGLPSTAEKNVYTHIQRVQEQAVRACAPNVLISDIARNCRDDLGEEYNKYFTHALGHGLGTQVHEWPRVSTREDVYLEEGMVITIEPGVYVPNKWGVRIEDDILITKQGYTALTKSKKELIVV